MNEFRQRVSGGSLQRQIETLLEKECAYFYELGRSKKSRDVKSYIDTLSINIVNEKLSDSEFRSFAATLTKSLLASL